jgi:hypothetical protein
VSADQERFADGVLAADPHASGTYAWHALAPVIGSEDLVFSGGALHGLGLTFSAPLLVTIGAAVFAVGARAWRCLPLWRHR